MSPESYSKPTAFPPAWRTVSFGTFCLSVGAIFLLLGTLAFSTLVVFNSQLHNAPSVEGLENHARQLPSLSIIGCLLVLLTGAMIWLAGLSLLCLVPPETGARPLAWSAVVCWFLSLAMVLQIPLVSIGIRMRGPRFGDENRNDRDPIRMIYGSDAGFGLAAGMFAVAGVSFAMGTVCSIAHRFQNERLAQSARWFLLCQIVSMPAILFIFVAQNYVTENMRYLEWYYGILPFVLTLIAIPVIGCAWILRIFAETRRMLRTAEEISNEQLSMPST